MRGTIRTSARLYRQPAAISAVEAGFEMQAVLHARGSSFAIGEETSRRRMERAGVWLASTNTLVAELVGNWATPQGMALGPLLAADPPMLPVHRDGSERSAVAASGRIEVRA